MVELNVEKSVDKLAICWSHLLRRNRKVRSPSCSYKELCQLKFQKVEMKIELNKMRIQIIHFQSINGSKATFRTFRDGDLEELELAPL